MRLEARPDVTSCLSQFPMSVQGVNYFIAHWYTQMLVTLVIHADKLSRQCKVHGKIYISTTPVHDCFHPYPVYNILCSRNDAINSQLTITP